MNTRKVTGSVIAAIALLTIGGAAQADIGGALKMCVNCHGTDGRGTESDVPIIAGIPAFVQEDALYAYLDGDRDCGSKPLMCKSVSRLSEDQIVELAEHFAALPYVPANEDFDESLAGVGKTLHMKNCAICHGRDEPGDAQASILHGQRKDYIRYALQQYAAGKRKQLPAMEKKTTALSADDIEALLNYYASYQN